MVRAFFGEQELTRFITHTNLVFLPKKETMKHFSNLRPICRSIFMNKIISSLIHEGIVMVFPKLISPHSVKFCKGKKYHRKCFVGTENNHGHKKRAKNVSVMVKLDMTKAYDRVLDHFMTSIKLSYDGTSESSLISYELVICGIIFSSNCIQSR